MVNEKLQKARSLHSMGINPCNIASMLDVQIIDVLDVLNLNDRKIRSERALVNRIKRGTAIVEHDGVYKKCPNCKEWLPLDSSCWPQNKKNIDQSNSICICCDKSRRPLTRKAKNKLKQAGRIQRCIDIINTILTPSKILS